MILPLPHTVWGLLPGLYMILPLPHHKITRSELIMVQARSMLWFTQVSVNT